MSNVQSSAKSRGFAQCLALAAVLALGLAASADARGRGGRECSMTAFDQFHACLAEVRDDFFSARAKCRNVADDEERDDCFREAMGIWREGYPECREQLGARRDLCGEIGEERIDAGFEPELFDDPRNPSNPNPYYPLAVGNRWVYEGGDETVTVRVLDQTKLIDGVNCLVVNDLVEEDGRPIEDTDDWVGIRKDGGIAYCGEIARDFETFEGDDPELPELVSIDGSFKAGRDGDLAGTLFLAQPTEGAVYRQEWSAGNAEDAAKVLSTRYRFGSDAELDRHVPQELAEAMCGDADCVVTLDFTPIEPGAVERKYYARGVGLFLEVKPEDGETVELVECNVHAKCAELD